MRVALTGITGFVGQNLMPMIVEQCPDAELMTLNIESDLPKAQQMYPWKQCRHILTTELDQLEEFNPDEFIAPRHSMRHPLSPEARKQARAIAEEMRAKFEQINGALFVKRHQLRALENAANPDVKVVGECATEIVQLR